MWHRPCWSCSVCSGKCQNFKTLTVKSSSPTCLQARQRHPRAAMRDSVWGWLNKAQRSEEEWRSARWWKPDSEAVPEWFCEVKQTQRLKHITWLHWSEERERGSFTAQTETDFTFHMQRCLKPKCYRYNQEFNSPSNFEYIRVFFSF